MGVPRYRSWIKWPPGRQRALVHVGYSSATFVASCVLHSGRWCMATKNEGNSIALENNSVTEQRESQKRTRDCWVLS